MRVPPPYHPMGFAGRIAADLDGRWYAVDTRDNMFRIGRVLIARGREISTPGGV